MIWNIFFSSPSSSYNFFFPANYWLMLASFFLAHVFFQPIGLMSYHFLDSFAVLGFQVSICFYKLKFRISRFQFVFTN
jgi:hypothetical protein